MRKLALVTGGSRGIGAATVGLLRERGWDVLAPGRGELDFEKQHIVLDWCANKLIHGPCMFDAVIFCHGEWFSRPLDFQLSPHYIGQYQTRVISPLIVLSVFLYRIKEISGSVVMVS